MGVLGSHRNHRRYELQMRSRRKNFLFLALACQFAFAVVPPSGLFLCLGADGHFDVEAPHGGRACHAKPGESAKSDCRDIAIAPSQLAERRNVEPQEFHRPALQFVTLSPPQPPSTFVLQSIPRSPSLGVLEREARRTVVLLV